MSDSSFSTLPLQASLLGNLDSLGFKSMTPIQAQALPEILAGKDVIGQGKTGSGKTAAFGLGVLNKLNVKKFKIQSLILCPTRELADQVAKELRRLARGIHNIKILTLCGGMPIGPQIGSLEHGAHIIVGTAGRVEDHLRKGTLSLDAVDTLVLDEADRMLDMGFQDSVDAIVEQTPAKKQVLLFSATFPPNIERISKKLMRNPTRIEVKSENNTSNITQYLYGVKNTNRLDTLAALLSETTPETSLVFCNTKRETEEVANGLRSYGFDALAIHGDLDQKTRYEILVRFSNKSASILVATDVAARGLDIEQLDAVFNFHIAKETAVHVHRIGRTGRAGATGVAYTFFEKSEEYKVERLQSQFNDSIDVIASFEPPANIESFHAPMATLQIDSGKKQKIRPGDILGALTASGEIKGKSVGSIDIFDHCAYVAIERTQAKLAQKILSDGNIKGKRCRVRRIRG